MSVRSNSENDKDEDAAQNTAYSVSQENKSASTKRKRNNKGEKEKDKEEEGKGNITTNKQNQRNAVIFTGRALQEITRDLTMQKAFMTLAYISDMMVGSEVSPL